MVQVKLLAVCATRHVWEQTLWKWYVKEVHLTGPDYRVHDTEVTGITTATTIVSDLGIMWLYCRAEWSFLLLLLLLILILLLLPLLLLLLLLLPLLLLLLLRWHYSLMWTFVFLMDFPQPAPFLISFSNFFIFVFINIYLYTVLPSVFLSSS